MKIIKRLNRLLPLLLFGILPLFFSCEKDKKIVGRDEFLLVSGTPEKVETKSVKCRLEGGEYVLYAFANIDYSTSFQTTNTDLQWVKVRSTEYIPDVGANRIVLDVAPLQNTIARRTGTLIVACREHYLAQFIVFSQGFENYAETFTEWTYGDASPYITLNETPIKNWNSTLTNKGWTSTIATGQDSACCYGKNGYLKLGNETIGADLVTPMFAGYKWDSGMLLLFSIDAVAYTSKEGVQDNNELTVELLDGGEFEDGGTSKTIRLGYINPNDPQVAASMWNNATYPFFIKNTARNPYTDRMRIRFLTGNDILSSGNNRVFIDNFRHYIVDEEYYNTQANP